MNRYIDADKYRKDLLSTYDDVSIELEVLDRQPLASVISLDKIMQAREEIESLTPWDDGLVEMHEVLSVLDKLMESEDKE